MAYQEDSAVVVLQQAFEQFERVDVQVVGWLVEHQHVGWPREQARQQQSISFAAAQ